MRIYSLYDRKLREFGQLVLLNNDETVMRSLKDQVPGSKSGLERYPEDYDVKCLGEFDAESGTIVPVRVPRLVVNLRELLETKEVVSEAQAEFAFVKERV